MSNVNFTTSKSIGVPPEIKAHQAKANMAGGSELATWLEQATSYVANVRAGIEQEDPNGYPLWQYDQWINQVRAQMFGGGGGGWDPMMAGGAAAQPQAQAPQGAFVGADGNFCFDGKSAILEYNGSPVRHDVESTDVTMAVDSMGADYSFTMVDDGTGNQVLKLVISGPQGEQTYLFNNVNDPEFQLDIFAANKDKLDVALAGLATSDPDIAKNITPKDIEEFGEALATGGEADLDGVPVEPEEVTDPTTGDVIGDLYKADNTDQIFHFNPQAGGEITAHKVVGNATITVPLDASVQVAYAPGQSIGGVPFDYVIQVTHADNSHDTYFVEKDFDFTINARPGKVTFGAVPTLAADGTVTLSGGTADTSGIPADFVDNFTTTASGEAAAAGAAAGTDAQAVIDSLLTATNSNEAQFLEGLQNAGFTQFTDMDKVREAIEAGTFPPLPAPADQTGEFHQFVDFLIAIDDGLYDAHQEWMAACQGREGTDPEAASDDFNERLVVLMGPCFPNSKVREVPYDPAKPWAANFSIGDDPYWLSIYQNGDFVVG